MSFSGHKSRREKVLEKCRKMWSWWEMDFSRRDAKAQRFVDGERENLERATFNAQPENRNH